MCSQRIYYGQARSARMNTPATEQLLHNRSHDLEDEVRILTYQPKFEDLPWDQFPWRSEDLHSYYDRTYFDFRKHLLECDIAGESCLAATGEYHKWKRSFTKDKGCNTLQLLGDVAVGAPVELKFLFDTMVLQPSDLLIDYYIHYVNASVQTLPGSYHVVTGQFNIGQSSEAGTLTTVSLEQWIEDTLVSLKRYNPDQYYDYNKCLQKCAEAKINTNSEAVVCDLPWARTSSKTTSRPRCRTYDQFVSTLEYMEGILGNATNDCRCPPSSSRHDYRAHIVSSQQSSPYQRIQFYSRVETKGTFRLYLWQQLIADIGGVLSLFYGQSAICGVSLIELLATWVLAHFAYSQDDTAVYRRTVLIRMCWWGLRIVPGIILIYCVVFLTQRAFSPYVRIDVNNSATVYLRLPSISLCMLNKNISIDNFDYLARNSSRQELQPQEGTFINSWREQLENPHPYLKHCEVKEKNCTSIEGPNHKWEFSIINMNGTYDCLTLNASLSDVTEKISITFTFNQHLMHSTEKSFRIFIHSFSKLTNLFSPQHPEVSEVFVRKGITEMFFSQETRVSRRPCGYNIEKCLEERALVMSRVTNRSLLCNPLLRASDQCTSAQEVNGSSIETVRSACTCPKPCYSSTYVLHAKKSEVSSNGYDSLRLTVVDSGSTVFSETTFYEKLRYVAHLGGCFGFLSGISGLGVATYIICFVISKLEKMYEEDTKMKSNLEIIKQLLVLLFCVVLWSGVLVLVMKAVSGMSFTEKMHYHARVDDDIVVVPSVTVCFQLSQWSSEWMREPLAKTTFPKELSSCWFLGEECMNNTGDLYLWNRFLSINKECLTFTSALKQTTSSFDLILSTERHVESITIHRQNEVPPKYSTEAYIGVQKHAYFHHRYSLEINAESINHPKPGSYQIRATGFKREHAARYDCEDNQEYSEAKCLDLCMEKQARRHNGCFTRWMYRDQEGYVCTDKQVGISRNVTLDLPGSLVCSCLPPCLRFHWTSTLAAVSPVVPALNFIPTYRFTFLPHQSITYVDDQHFSVSQFLGTVGGIIGLMTGGSLLSSFSLNSCRPPCNGN